MEKFPEFTIHFMMSLAISGNDCFNSKLQRQNYNLSNGLRRRLLGSCWPWLTTSYHFHATTILTASQIPNYFQDCNTNAQHISSPLSAASDRPRYILHIRFWTTSSELRSAVVRSSYKKFDRCALLSFYGSKPAPVHAPPVQLRLIDFRATFRRAPRENQQVYSHQRSYRLNYFHTVRQRAITQPSIRCDHYMSSWNPDERKLETFHMNCQRTLGLRWCHQSCEQGLICQTS